MFLLYVYSESSILNMYKLYIKMGQIILIYSFFVYYYEIMTPSTFYYYFLHLYLA